MLIVVVLFLASARVITSITAIERDDAAAAVRVDRLPSADLRAHGT